MEKKKIADAHIHTHTLSRTHPKPPPESLWSAREKMSINTSVGLPWLEHVTVSLFSGCVNLFCRVCCESVYSLKQRSMPAGFFFSSPRRLCGAQSFRCFPSLSVSRPRANTEMEYRVIRQSDYRPRLFPVARHRAMGLVSTPLSTMRIFLCCIRLHVSRLVQTFPLFSLKSALFSVQFRALPCRLPF